MTIIVRFFAILRQQTRLDELTLTVPERTTAASVCEKLQAEFPAAAAAMKRSAIAINREYAGPETMLQHGDELALIPPVSGG